MPLCGPPSEDLTGRANPAASYGECARYCGSKPVGYVASGTMVPYWKNQEYGNEPQIAGAKGLRAIGLALLDSDLKEKDEIQVEIRNKRVRDRIVSHHLKNDTPPLARAILWQ